MNYREKTRHLILEHFDRYPKSKLGDLFKFLHQSSFGCEHLVKSHDMALGRIKAEYTAMTRNEHRPLVEELDGDYSRVDLAYLDEGLSAKTLSTLFVLSAKTEPRGLSALEEKFNVAETLISEGLVPIGLDEFERERAKWRSQGYPALHHSDEFRNAYSPSYRVISNRFVPFLPLFAKLDSTHTNDSTILAIDGGSASGKSTLGDILEALYDCTVFHVDDFFLPPEMRTPERLAEAGGNFDRERFLSEILLPLSRGDEVVMRRFDCQTMSLCPPATVKPSSLTVIEGAYSMHPELRDHYNISVFLDISPEKQRERIEKRNSPQFAKRFFEEWIPLEERYFSEMSIKDKCDLIIKV